MSTHRRETGRQSFKNPESPFLGSEDRIALRQLKGRLPCLVLKETRKPYRTPPTVHLSQSCVVVLPGRDRCRKGGALVSGPSPLLIVVNLAGAHPSQIYHNPKKACYGSDSKVWSSVELKSPLRISTFSGGQLFNAFDNALKKTHLSWPSHGA